MQHDVGCNLDVPGIAGIPQVSVVVMTDADGTGWWSLRGYRNERPMEQIVQMLTCDDCALYVHLSSSGIRETQGCESTHSPRGHEGLLCPSLGDGTWATYFEGTWLPSTSC